MSQQVSCTSDRPISVGRFNLIGPLYLLPPGPQALLEISIPATRAELSSGADAVALAAVCASR